MDIRDLVIRTTGRRWALTEEMDTIRKWAHVSVALDSVAVLVTRLVEATEEIFLAAVGLGLALVLILICE
jgi:hypothetical protein